jgi:hypothetical protein
MIEIGNHGQESNSKLPILSTVFDIWMVWLHMPVTKCIQCKDQLSYWPSDGIEWQSYSCPWSTKLPI